MNREPEENLERLIDERLRALPQLRAPETLIPNVMQKIAARKPLAWWRRAWPEWPRGMQVLSVALLAAVLGAVWYYGDALKVYADSLSVTGQVGGVFSFIRPIITLLGAFVSVFQALVGWIKTEYIIIGAAVAAALYLTAIALGSLCFRLAADRNHSF